MRIRTLLAAGGLAVAVVTGSAGIAAAAPAHSGPGTTNGNGNVGAFGNTRTGGTQSPQIGLVQGSLNKPCVGLAGKVNVGSLIGVIPVTLQDLNVLSSPQNQQCTDNSAQIKGDEPLSHILSDDPILSGNGARFGGHDRR
ncbi:rodlin [Streptomyces sp. HPF1205]|uniref:rodlin n=1 Tax=Streptomyces sp. HPF1205 TaxID=2873262 RepID=UPI001CEC1BDC|nr:rodlin [Streptomyces sp. HPF1205]